jgi:hypothetical protein
MALAGLRVIETVVLEVAIEDVGYVLSRRNGLVVLLAEFPLLLPDFRTEWSLRRHSRPGFKQPEPDAAGRLFMQVQAISGKVLASGQRRGVPLSQMRT